MTGAEEMMGLAVARDFGRLWRSRHFLRAQRAGGFEIPDQPSFDAAALDYFREKIRSSHIYLEYGSGGSTLWAAAQVETLVSVESDRYFLRGVEQRLETKENQRRELIHANIGPTTTWGSPIFHRPTRRRVRQWANYPQAPWRWLLNQKLVPDTILVDGRFRLACVLESALHIQDPDKSTILMDDYENRPYYHDAEAFCDVRRMAGRMAVLRPKADLDRQALNERLTVAYSDFR